MLGTAQAAEIGEGKMDEPAVDILLSLKGP